MKADDSNIHYGHQNMSAIYWLEFFIEDFFHLLAYLSFLQILYMYFILEWMICRQVENTRMFDCQQKRIVSAFDKHMTFQLIIYA